MRQHSLRERQDKQAQNHPEILPATYFRSEVPEELADRTKLSPVVTMGGSIFLVFHIIIAGFVIMARI